MADSSALTLAKLLDYIPKTSSQDLFPYLATDSFQRLMAKVQLSKHQGPAIKVHYLTTLAILSNQDLATRLVHPSRDFPFSP